MSNHFKLIVPGTLNTEKGVYNCVLSSYLQGKRFLNYSDLPTEHLLIFLYGKKKNTTQKQNFPNSSLLVPFQGSRVVRHSCQASPLMLKWLTYNDKKKNQEEEVNQLDSTTDWKNSFLPSVPSLFSVHLTENV